MRISDWSSDVCSSDLAANFGIRPSFDPPKELLEPHFFDFAEELYGQEIDVAFHAFIRPEAKFDDMDALMAQIAADCEEARRLQIGRASCRERVCEYV